jgi:hypothetical protein
MSLSYAEEINLARNPLDLLEEVAGALDWLPSSGQSAVEISGGRDSGGVDHNCRNGLTR